MKYETRGALFIDAPLPDDGGIHADNARSLGQMFTRIYDRMALHLIFLHEISPEVWTLRKQIATAVLKDEVAVEAVNLRAKFIDAKDDVDNGAAIWESIPHADIELKRLDLLNLWRNKNDRAALRQANIISENATWEHIRNIIDPENTYQLRLAEAADHYYTYEEVYKMLAVQSAQAQGIDISYPPYSDPHPVEQTI